MTDERVMIPGKEYELASMEPGHSNAHIANSQWIFVGAKALVGQIIRRIKRHLHREGRDLAHEWKV